MKDEDFRPSTQALAALAPDSPNKRYAILGCSGCLTVFGVLFAGLILLPQFLAMLLAVPHFLAYATFLGFLICVPYALLFIWIDRNEPEPLPLLLLAFLWGAVFATGWSILFNTVFQAAAQEVVGDPMLGAYLTGALSAPFFEEITKALAVMVIFIFFPRHFDNVLDGIVYGALAGLGFATIENIFYYVNFGAASNSFGTVTFLFVLRGVLGGIGSHALYTAIFGAGLGLFRVLRTGVLRWFVPPAALGLAMFLHFVWNAVAAVLVEVFGGGEMLTTVFTMALAVLVFHIPFVLGMFIIVAVVLRSENKIIREHLAGEQTSIVRPEDLEDLLPARRRAWRGLKLLFSDFSAFQAFRKRNRLLVRLAFEKWHMRTESSHGRDDLARQHAQSVLEIRARLAQR